ncbi:MAG: FkbM family methyltransferase [Pseudobdellovibrionaceae bacterium]|nr:FkbM family methyltransferase [Pseudobdellovibrionaceae bacterium]
MFNVLARVAIASEKYRRRYGQIAGFLLWFRLRRHMKAIRGTLHKVRVPGLAHPIFLRAGTSDVLVFIQIFIERELEFEMAEEPLSIVDAGANIGLASLYFAKRFPKSKIVALEVDRANFDLLTKNTSGYPNITCIRKALWSGQAQLSILNPTDEPWAFRVGEVSDGDGNSIPALGVCDLVGQFESQRIDLLKVDIEGAGKEVFKNGTDQWIDRIGVLAVELRDNIVPGCSKAFVEALVGKNHRTSRSGEYGIAQLQGQRLGDSSAA